VKPPRVGSEKPWHQDNAYFRVTPLDQVLGVWIALDDATVENGCMHVLPDGHKRGPLRHYHGRDCEIVPDRIGDYLGEPIELPAGGALFFFGMLPHRTPVNTSSQRRRALQLHYRGAHSIQNEQADYDAIFAEADGSPASCHAGRVRGGPARPAEGIENTPRRPPRPCGTPSGVRETRHRHRWAATGTRAPPPVCNGVSPALARA
jgi:hypothetical protein